MSHASGGDSKNDQQIITVINGIHRGNGSNVKQQVHGKVVILIERHVGNATSNLCIILTCRVSALIHETLKKYCVHIEYYMGNGISVMSAVQFSLLN